MYTEPIPYIQTVGPIAVHFIKIILPSKPNGATENLVFQKDIWSYIIYTELTTKSHEGTVSVGRYIHVRLSENGNESVYWQFFTLVTSKLMSPIDPQLICQQHAEASIKRVGHYEK